VSFFFGEGQVNVRECAAHRRHCSNWAAFGCTG
jgi:hypothetical protein